KGNSMSIKYAILGLLNYSDMHGYRIKTHIENNFGHMWSINFGQIYPGLKELKNSGLIDMVDVTPSDNGGPRKKLYSITEKGRDEFMQWLTSPPLKPMLIRDAFLLKFAFFGFGDKNAAIEILDTQIKIFEDQLKRRKANLTRWKNIGTYVRLITELGVSQNEMYLKWLRRARKEIEVEERSSKRSMIPDTER
ncbi:MAG: PadR family transcriptional regulator, partial [Syntrophales bacterium]|nr:PadR family transcriptional regulator [Syntrophales bacterium]